MANPTQVEMPDGEIVEFPVGMPDEEIGKHVQEYIGNKGAQSPIPPPGLHRPDPGMHKSFMVGDENEDPDEPQHSSKEIGRAVTGAAEGAYSASAPNVAHQLLKKIKGQPSDLVTPVENAIGMMAGEEGLMEGGAAETGARTAAPTVEAGAKGGKLRSFPTASSRASSGAAVGTSGGGSGASGVDLLKAGSKLIPGVGKVAHMADFASTAMSLLKRIRGDNGGAEEAASSAAPEGVTTTLHPHESTAVPQSFPPTGGYSVSGRPVGSTQEFLNANRPAPPAAPPRPAPAWKSQPNVSAENGGHSVKDILVKANSQPQPPSSWVSDPARGIPQEEWDAGHAIADEENRGAIGDAVGQLMRKAPSLADDAAMAGRPKTEAQTIEPTSAAKRLVKKKVDNIEMDKDGRAYTETGERDPMMDAPPADATHLYRTEVPKSPVSGEREGYHVTTSNRVAKINEAGLKPRTPRGAEEGLGAKGVYFYRKPVQHGNVIESAAEGNPMLRARIPSSHVTYEDPEISFSGGDDFLTRERIPPENLQKVFDEGEPMHEMFRADRLDDQAVRQAVEAKAKLRKK